MIEKPKRKKNKGANQWQAFRRNWLKNNPPNYKGFWSCATCGKDVDKYNLHLDHIVTRGSAPQLKYEASNIRISCSGCHLKRHGIL